MKKVIPLLLIALTSLLGQKANAQVDKIPYYANINFAGSFYVIAEHNDNSNFYAINLDQLDSDFERAYFTSLTFKEKKIVRLDAGNPHIAWFRAKKSDPETGINELFLSLKQQTITQTARMTELQKQEWMLNNNK